MKRSKVLFSFLFVLVFMLQLVGTAFAAPAEASEFDGDAALGYALYTVNDDGETVIVDGTNNVLGDGETCGITLDGEDFPADAMLSALLSKDIGINPPEGWYIRSLFLRADGAEGGESVDLKDRATASATSPDLLLTSKSMTVNDDSNTYFAKDAIPGQSAKYVLDIVLAETPTDVTVNGKAFNGDTVPEAVTPDSKYQEFAGWLITYTDNGSKVLVPAGAEFAPYASCTLEAQFRNIVYTATVTAENKTMKLGEPLPDFTAGVSAQTLKGMNVSGLIFTIEKDNEAVDTAALAVGEYDIVVSGGTFTDVDGNAVPAENLSIDYVAGKLTVNAATQEKTSITVTATAPVYDEANSTYKLADTEADRYTIDVDLADGDTEAVTVELVKDETTGKFTAKVTDVKIYNGTTDVSDNYEIHKVDSEAVSVPAAPIEITVTATKPVLGADGKTYNNDSAIVTSGELVDEDKLGNLTFKPLELKDGKYVSELESVQILDKDGNPVATDKYKVTLAPSEAVTPDTIPAERGEITVKAKDRTETYNGTEIKANDYELTGTLANGDKLEVSYEGGSVNATSSPVESKPVVVIKDKDGKDVTEEYTVKTEAGKVTVNKFNITITAVDFEKKYDGKSFNTADINKATRSALANDSHSISLSDLSFEVRKDGNKVNAVEVGTYSNVVTKVIIRDADKNDITANYNVTFKDGTLKIKGETVATIVTVTAKSQTWVYDGKAHTYTEYEVTGLKDGDKVEKVTFKNTSTITNAGSVDNVIESVVIKTADGKSVASGKYDVKTVNGKLTVTKAPLTLTAESASKTYDGKALDNKNVKATSLANPNHKLTVTLAITDSKGNTIQNGAVNVGTYTKKIDKYTIMDGSTDVTANYEVKTVDGTLTIKASDKNDSTNPKTGDESNIGLWIGLLAASAVIIAAIIVVIILKNKKKNNEPEEPQDDDFDDLK